MLLVVGLDLLMRSWVMLGGQLGVSRPQSLLLNRESPLAGPGLSELGLSWHLSIQAWVVAGRRDVPYPNYTVSKR